MKISPSLKLYFIGMIFITGASTVSIMSAVSIHYFFEGIDFSMVDSMRSQVFKHDLENGKAIQVDHFTIANKWEDLPQPIKDNLDENDLEDDQLLKLIDGIPLLTEPKAGYFAMKVSREGETRYISSMFSIELDTNKSSQLNHSFKHPPPQEGKPRRPNDFIYIIVIALFGILIFSLLPYIILRRVTTPVGKLMLWAKSLNKDLLSQPIPDFHYSELNSLATMMKESLSSVQDTLIREQRFLGYASHELRTPIAVTRTNSELLRKMITKGINVEKQQFVVDRIERACLTMTDLTETLLWLNRQPEKLIPVKSLSLGALTQQVLEEVSYIREGKSVVLLQETDQSNYELPEPLCRIIITNLIRNAFQHTQQGSVSITQRNATVIITNTNKFPEDSIEINTKSPEHNGLGFGLGLELTKRLVEQYGWDYSNIANNAGHHVEINFVPSK